MDRIDDATVRVSGTPRGAGRVQIAGKLFQLNGQKWYLKGLTYGPFKPDAGGNFLPGPSQISTDFAQICGLGANAIRLYHPPPAFLLDQALEQGLRVLIDVPWEKHRCFLEDWSSQEDALRRVRQTARELCNHPAVFAVSVANEIPHDVVRYYGAARVEKFIDRLLDVAKQEAPDCLVTYANYPPTEFLSPSRLDFYCANVYLDDAEVLGSYLDRLQHVAGSLPLVLGEYGVDTMRHGQDAQAESLRAHVEEVFRRGLAGSFVFAFTDDWFTGGHRIEDWAFGVTDANRSPKRAAAELARVWRSVPRVPKRRLPKVSVVVCSYNGAATLDECLRSLVALEYPDYEVILVDDGSTDRTPEVAARFPRVRYLRQPNMGLSGARNVGAEAAAGEIIVYTDSDCVADETWLLYLVQAMQDQEVDAIGGPNLPPPTDSWTAKCVAASPGGPSHVMLDDRFAEHVPGCNMAFRRDALLAIGGFDAQFRQAGDDVDVCWRLLDAGKRIGYAASAVVWHHRRNTVRAYLRQQKGYGRSEAMLHFKHPHRFNLLGCARWNGIIYGEGAVGLPLSSSLVYHGRFGSGLFQIVYRQNRYSFWAYFTLLEWHALAVLLLALGVATFRPLTAVPLTMWIFTLLAVVRATWKAPLAPQSPWWCRPVVGVLHLLQPLIRAWHRAAYRLSHRRLPRSDGCVPREHVKRISPFRVDLYFQSEDARGREHLLDALETEAKESGWHGDFHAEWQAHDVELVGDRSYDVRVCTATEELGYPRRFTRARCSLRPSLFTLGAGAVTLLWSVAGLATGTRSVVWAAVGAWILLVTALLRSRGRCRRAVATLIYNAAVAARLQPVRLTGEVAATNGSPAAARDLSPAIATASRLSAAARAQTRGEKCWQASEIVVGERADPHVEDLPLSNCS
jgi:GT2 family glycosyltransferase